MCFRCRMDSVRCGNHLVLFRSFCGLGLLWMNSQEALTPKSICGGPWLLQRSQTEVVTTHFAGINPIKGRFTHESACFRCQLAPKKRRNEIQTVVGQFWKQKKIPELNNSGPLGLWYVFRPAKWPTFTLFSLSFWSSSTQVLQRVAAMLKKFTACEMKMTKCAGLRSRPPLHDCTLSTQCEARTCTSDGWLRQLA